MALTSGGVSAILSLSSEGVPEIGLFREDAHRVDLEAGLFTADIRCSPFHAPEVGRCRVR